MGQISSASPAMKKKKKADVCGEKKSAWSIGPDWNQLLSAHTPPLPLYPPAISLAGHPSARASANTNLVLLRVSSW